MAPNGTVTNQETATRSGTARRYSNTKARRCSAQTLQTGHDWLARRDLGPGSPLISRRTASTRASPSNGFGRNFHRIAPRLSGSASPWSSQT